MPEGRNAEYWADRSNRAELARKHTDYIEEKFRNNLKNTIDKTTFYTGLANITPTHDRKGKILVIAKDSVSAVFMASPGKKNAVMNFASFTSPGGKFIDGSSAQEESLCHASSLYNALSRFSGFYSENRNNFYNNSLYSERGIYLPNVVFEKDGKQTNCDVITVAAPNKYNAQKNHHISDAENTKALTDRIRFVLQIAAQQNVATLIAGAFGCGVFGQDPKETSKIFRELLSGEFKNTFENIVFAIPYSERNKNLEIFRDVLNNPAEKTISDMEECR